MVRGSNESALIYGCIMPSWLDKFVKVGKGDDDAEAPVVPVTPSPKAPGPMGISIPAAPRVAGTPQVVVARTPMDYTLDEVFVEGGAATGKNSAETAIKLREGLVAFPEAQQIAMIRAMDSADDSWDEATVVADAKRRVLISDEYLKMVDADESNRIAKINTDCDAETQANQNRVADLDGQIAALKAEREQVIGQSAAARAAADGKIEAVKVRANGIKDAVATVAAKYKEVVKFFGAK